jgi:hypothetical protein
MAQCSAHRLIAPLLAIPGVREKQRGDREINVMFQPESFDRVVELLRARKPRLPLCEELRRLLAGSMIDVFCLGSYLGDCERYQKG